MKLKGLRLRLVWCTFNAITKGLQGNEFQMPERKWMHVRNSEIGKAFEVTERKTNTVENTCFFFYVDQRTAILHIQEENKRLDPRDLQLVLFH